MAVRVEDAKKPAAADAANATRRGAGEAAKVDAVFET
jgi:hypothetical protein